MRGYRLIIALMMLVLAFSCSYFQPVDKEEKAEKAEKIKEAAKPVGPRNVVLFIGDGMGLATVTAARLYKVGVNGKLTMESLPYTALVRTYSADSIVTDSAAGGTALACGYKTNNGVIGMDSSTVRGEKDGTIINSILKYCQDEGMATGLVTTSMVTDATPAAFYAHVNDRANHEQIAEQFLASGIEVLLGGGRSVFLPLTAEDPEAGTGKRTDGKNLITELEYQDYKYVYDLAGFENISAENTDKLLGLFNPWTMEYEYDRPNDKLGEPSLAEMTTKAIDILAKDPDGYFLMVEGARIDHAAHANQGLRYVYDTLALDEAVKVALDKTGQDTLIIVTADHETGGAAINGYPDHSYAEAKFFQPFKSGDTQITILSWSTGPGGDSKAEQASADNPNYSQPATFKLVSATHTGVEVPLLAAGPEANNFHGYIENTQVPRIIARVLGIEID